ncbi:hypothetical protein GFL51_09370 [Rhizobium leguminosarum bv. viciae]|nr:hypothetical protein [Rhizobium leguminosarum bv. viciae]
MNDIDNRCDGYLAWLDSRRRWNGPIQKQIADTGTATALIMTATGAGNAAIGVVAAAFGLARNSFDSSQSRLLMEVNHSTVQTIVLANQDRFRKQLQGISVDSQPAAIYVLRQYLRLCMPYTIENEINTTITTYQLGGTRALAAAEASPLIELASLARKPIRPEIKLVRPQTVVIRDNEQFRFVVHNPESTSTKIITKALVGICATPEEIANPSKQTIARVKVLQQWRQMSSGLPNKKVDGKMDSGDLAVASAQPQCTPGTQNFYEAREYPGGIMTTAPDLIELFNGKLAENEKLPADANEDAIRTAVEKLKSHMPNLKLNDPELSKQLTLEFIQKF